MHDASAQGSRAKDGAIDLQPNDWTTDLRPQRRYLLYLLKLLRRHITPLPPGSNTARDTRSRGWDYYPLSERALTDWLEQATGDPGYLLYNCGVTIGYWVLAGY